MKGMWNRIGVLWMLVFVAGIPHSAWAGKVPVRASLVRRCAVVNVEEMHFGEIDPSVLRTVYASANVTYWCSIGSPYVLDVDEGSNYDPARGARQMQHGSDHSDTLHYHLVEPVHIEGVGKGAIQPEIHEVRAFLLPSDIQKIRASDYFDHLTATFEP